MRRELGSSDPVLGPCGETGGFSYAAFTDAVQRYTQADIREVINQAHRGWRFEPGVLEFFHDLAVHLSEDERYSWDERVALDSLGLSIDYQLGRITTQSGT